MSRRTSTFDLHLVSAVLPVILLASLLPSCAVPELERPSRPPEAARPAKAAAQKLSQQEKLALQEVQGLYSRGAYPEVISKSEAFESRFPRSSKIAEILNFKGLAQLLTHQSSDAVASFRQATERAPDAFAGDRNWRSYVRYNLAAALADSGSPQAALDELRRIDPETLDTANRIKFHQLKARVFEQADKPVLAAQEWIALSLLPQSPELARVPLEQGAGAALARIQDLAELQDLARMSEKSSLAPVVLLRLIRRELEAQKPAEAKLHIDEFRRNFPDHPQASQLGSLAEAGAVAASAPELPGPAQPVVGLLVPQTGKFARIGQRIIQSVSLSLGLFDGQGNSSGSPALGGLSLVVEDAGEDPESALRALDRLHRVHRVALVIGPILSKGAEQVVARAEALRLPLISLAQQGAAFGEFATQGAVTPKLQAEEIARYATQSLGYKKFAILSPRDRFGEEYSQEFWNAIERLGGTITAYETYDSGETDFRQSLDRLSGTFYKDARQREVDALTQERETNKIKKRTRRTEKYFALPPVISFEAVFIPDEPKSVGLALPTFTYRDIDGVKFLGISAWNSPEMIQRAQKSAEGAVFVDSYFPLSTSPVVRRFAERYRLAFGQEPGSLDAVAFDVGSQAERAVSLETSGGSVERGRVAARIRQIHDAPGVTGNLTVRDGYWSRDLKILTIADQQVAEAPRKAARPAD